MSVATSQRSRIRSLAGAAINSLLVKAPFSEPITRWLRRHSSRWRILSRVGRHFPVRGTFELSTGVARFVLVADRDPFAVGLFWEGLNAWEAETHRLLPVLLEEADVFVDVGANNGVYSLLATAIRPSLIVHAFEPEPNARARLSRNAAANSMPGIIIHPEALTDKVGTSTLYVTEGSGTESSLLPEFRKVTTPVQISVSTLDTVMAGIPKVDVMKIDTEGTEDAVIRGGLETIRRDHPLIICEVLPMEPAELRLGPLLQDLGYVGFHITAGGLKETYPLLGDPMSAERNFLLVHEKQAPMLTARIQP